MLFHKWIDRVRNIIVKPFSTQHTFRLSKTSSELQAGYTCPVCQASLCIGDVVVRCPLCRVTIHADCAEYNDNKCPKLGCSGKLTVQPGKVHISVSGSNAEEVEFVARSLFKQTQPEFIIREDNQSIIKILFIAANPVDTSNLRLDEEVRGIDLALRQANFRDRFDIEQYWAVRIADLQEYFLRHKPDIVHFSGHGSVSSEIVLEDNFGRSHPVSTRALSKLFFVLKDNIKCVVLNACYSEKQARAIAEHIDCVIGMSKAIGDSSAISFASAFYRALGYGRDVQTAFDLGCLQIDLENLNEQDTPTLLVIQKDPKDIVFINIKSV